MFLFTRARCLIASMIALLMVMPLLVMGPANALETEENATEFAAAGSFFDVRSDNQFFDEISWLAAKRISTGYSDGSFRPLEPVNRDAMAAFMYRLAGSPAYTPPTTSPFTDVTTRTQFYKEISWLASKKISTGYPDKSYRPLEPVNRDAMAAFMYRLAGSPSYTASPTPRFTDVGTGVQFYKEISWLASKKISEGWSDRTYRPLLPVNRDAMAAFMYRYAGSPAITAPPVSPVSAVTAYAATPTTVSLRWANPASSAYTGVLIRRAAGNVAPASPTEGVAVSDVPVPKTTVTNTGLQPLTTYSFSYFAHDGDGRFAAPAKATVTTPGEATVGGPSLSDQRTTLRAQITAAKNLYVDSRPFISLLARADGLIVKDAIANGTISLDKTGVLVTAATTQTAMTAAAKSVDAESLRAATVKTSATQMKSLKDLRLVQQNVAKTALSDLKAARISASAYQATKVRAEAFTTILAADRVAQRNVIGKVAAAAKLQAPAWRDELEGRTGSIPSVSGWVGFLGGCALPVAESKFVPKLPVSGPGVVTTNKMIADANLRAASDPAIEKVHGQMIRGAANQAADVLTIDQLRGSFSTRVSRLGYGWLQAGDTKSRDALRSDTKRILESGPESMSTLTASHLLLAAGTANDWAPVAGMDETVLVRWLGPQTCLHADRENFVDAATNIAAIHNAATFVASAVYLEKSPAQAGALAKESLVSIQPALAMVTADGGSQEGPGYWTYESRAFATVYSTLPNVYASNPILIPSLAKTADYAMNSTGPDGLPTPFADSEPNPLSPLMPAWISYTTKDPGVAAWVWKENQVKPDSQLMWWWAKPGQLPAKKSTVYPFTGFAALHLPSGSTAGTATLKGGENTTAHSHLDVGTVSFFRKGVQWSIDPGTELNNPTGYYSAATRWDFWKPGTSAHSTLLLGQSNQPIGAKGATKLLSSSSASVDMVQALPGTSSATRTITLDSASLVVADVVKANSGKALTWQWVTDAAVTIDTNLNRAILAKNGQQITISFGGVPSGSKLGAVAAPGKGPDGKALTIIKMTMVKVSNLNLTATVK
ncbi:S-layer homology domain-containing protein [Arthrobacter sp. TMT4-20]